MRINWTPSVDAADLSIIMEVTVLHLAVPQLSADLFFISRPKELKLS